MGENKEFPKKSWDEAKKEMDWNKIFKGDNEFHNIEDFCNKIISVDDQAKTQEESKSGHNETESKNKIEDLQMQCRLIGNEGERMITKESIFEEFKIAKEKDIAKSKTFVYENVFTNRIAVLESHRDGFRRHN